MHPSTSPKPAPLIKRLSTPVNPPTLQRRRSGSRPRGGQKKGKKKKKKTYTAIHALDSEQLKNETKYGSRGVVPRRPAFSSARELNVYRDRLGRLYFEVLVRADVRIS